MNPETIINRLEANSLVFASLLQGLPREMYLYKITEESWCLLEVAAHLLDEEVEDFRARVQHILTTPDLPLKAIAPHKWPEERAYLQKEYNSTVAAFLKEREQSIAWLRSLSNPPWQNAVDHPEVGPRTALKFLVNWLAHDYHHIRQINRIHHGYLMATTKDDLTYAGNW